jgi:tetratricopeptide (TPR) repeat protein
MIRLNRAKAYEAIGDYDSAITDYDDLLKRKPDSSIYAAGRARAQEALDRKEGRQPAAPVKVEVQRVPDDSGGILLFAKALSNEANHPDEAIAEFGQVIEREPAFVFAYEHRCSLYLSAGKPDAALSDCSKAVDLGTDKIDAHSLRADVYVAMGRFLDAVADVDEIIRLKPDWANGYGQRCQIRALGNLELDEALKDCAAFERHGGKSVHGFESLALIEYRIARYADAIDAADKSLALDPKRATALYIRGLAKQKSGDAAGGNADIAAAKAIYPKIAEMYARHAVGP